MRNFSSLKLIPLIIGCIIIFTSKATAQNNNAKDGKIKEDPFHYSFTLNFNEYSVLNGALVSGLNKHGGGFSYAVNMANENNEIAWVFSLPDKDGMEALHEFLMEKSEEWKQAVKADSANVNKTSALNILAALMDKVSDARANPVWDIDIAEGILAKLGNKWLLEDSKGNYPITGNISPDFQKFQGKPIVAYGYKNNAGQFDLVRFIEKKQNTLELFVMSHCPVAQQVEKGIFTFMEQNQPAKMPRLEFHYIFYPPSASGKKGYSSLHGEEEIKENLVQICIRDHHPEIFTKYLISRLNNKPASWEELLRTLNIGEDAIRDISIALIKERNALIEKEYNYVNGIHHIKDGSPTFIWESRQIRDIATIRAFKNISFSVPANAGCSN
jgi:hypothetical protein